MDKLLTEVIIPLISTILIGMTTIFLTVIKNKINSFINTKEKKEVVKSVVESVEYLYTKLDIHNKSKEKLNLAKDNITSLLSEKGINISDAEMNVLINSTLHAMEQSTKETIEDLSNTLIHKKE